MSPELYNAILTRIRGRMEDNGFTQADLGQALGIKQSAISYILNGKTKLTLEQFMTLAKLLGEKPQQLIAEAEQGLTDVRQISSEAGQVLFKSPLHLLVHCAAAKAVRPEDLQTSRFSAKEIRAALEELREVGLVVKDGAVYRQKDVQVVYQPTSKVLKAKRDRAQLDVHRLSQDIWQAKDDNKEYKKRRFNYTMIDYFTPSQIREIESLLWRAYEKIKAAQKDNMIRDYMEGGEKYELWFAHFMLMTPLSE